MSARALSLACAVAAVAAGTSACAFAPFDEVACVDDAGCGQALVCAFGQCLDPNLAALGVLALEVDPGPQSVAPKQSFPAIDLGSSPRAQIELAAGVTMRGVVERDGVGVAAQVIAQPTRNVPGRTLATLVETDAAGSFALTGVEDARYNFAVLPADLALPPLYKDDQLQARGGASGTMELPPFRIEVAVVTVRGRVVAGDGASAQGIPGLDVRLVQPSGRRVSSTARTDAEGDFALAVADAGDDALRLEVRATADNELYPDVDVGGVLLVEGETERDLGDVTLGNVLSPVRLSALVLTEAGAPAGGAQVTLKGAVGVGTFVARATANAEGEVQVDVPPGVYDIVVLGAEGDPAAGLAILDDDDPPRNVPLEAPLTIQLPPRARYQGTITDPVLDTVPAATIALVRVGGENGLPESALDGAFVGFAEIAGDDGSFSVDVPPGTYRVTVRPALSSPAPMISRVVTIPAEGLQQDIELPDHAVVAGNVRFLGVPAAGSYVRVFGDDFDERGAAIQLGEGQCGPDGNFEIVVGTGP